MFPLAGTACEVLAARFVDRIGKGIRDAPCYALVADITPIEIRGAGYGIRQALDTVGGLVGPLLAMTPDGVYANDFRAVFWWAVVPAVLAVFLVMVSVQEPDGVKRTAPPGWPIHRGELKRLSSAFWTVVAIGVAFTLARFSQAFLVLKAQPEGLVLALILLVFVTRKLINIARFLHLVVQHSGHARNRETFGSAVGEPFFAIYATRALMQLLHYMLLPRYAW